MSFESSPVSTTPYLSGPCQICTHSDESVHSTTYIPASSLVISAVAPSSSDHANETTQPNHDGSHHQMQTRSKAGISKPRDFHEYEPHDLLAALLSQSEPKCNKSALKHPCWVEVMYE